MIYFTTICIVQSTYWSSPVADAAAAIATAALNRCDECYVVFSIIHRGGIQQKNRARTRSNRYAQ